MKKPTLTEEESTELKSVRLVKTRRQAILGIRDRFNRELWAQADSQPVGPTDRGTARFWAFWSTSSFLTGKSIYNFVKWLPGY